MIISKFKTQKLDVIKKNQPDLWLFVVNTFADLTAETQGKIAGAIIEWVLQSGGSPSVFDENLPSLTEQDLEEDFQ